MIGYTKDMKAPAGYAQQLVSQGYYGYAGWNDQEAYNDFQATGGQGKGGPQQQQGPSTTDSIVQATIDASKKQIEEETSYLAKYTQDNPFIFDEVLAKQSATAEYQPYYSELLDDYTKNIDLKRETVQDESKLSAELHKMDVGAKTREYDRAVERASEGFAGQGMFFSGIKKRSLGQGEVEQKADLTRGETVQEAQQRGYQRQNTALDLDQSQKTRDINREQQASIESGVLQRQSEAQKQYYYPLEQSYYRRFPTSSGSALKGYTLPEYYQYS